MQQLKPGMKRVKTNFVAEVYLSVPMNMTDIQLAAILTSNEFVLHPNGARDQLTKALILNAVAFSSVAEDNLTEILTVERTDDDAEHNT